MPVSEISASAHYLILLRNWTSACQWVAIALIFFGALVQVATIVLKASVEKLPSAAQWSTRLQWAVVILVVLGGLVQIATQQLGRVEKQAQEELAGIGKLYQEALNGSRKAYEELVLLAESSSSILKKEAEAKCSHISQELLCYRDIPAVRSNLKYEKDGREIPMDSLTASQLFELLARPTSSVLMRQSLMRYIISRPRQETLLACITTLEESDSLPAVAATCGILQRLLGKRTEFLDFAGWCEMCRSEIGDG